MRRIIIACALAGVLGVPAKADETLKWRHVQHNASQQSLEVSNGHVLSVYRLPGIAFFPDGSVGTTQGFGMSDILNSVGSANGYLFLTLSDGSELWTKWTAQLNPGKRGGTFTVIGGKGRYVGATGDGTFEVDGPLLNTPNPDAFAYVDSVVNIKK